MIQKRWPTALLAQTLTAERAETMPARIKDLAEAP
jgi:hypothetical protein